MIVLGLTGGIASGKSLATSVLAELGAKIIDCDQISHELTAKNCKGANLILEHFGERFFIDGELDRKRLATAVFSDQNMLERLNSLLHPLINSEANRRLESLDEKTDMVVVVSPLLFESDLDELIDFDEVWTISSDTELRLERLKERGIDEQQARAIMLSQFDDPQREWMSDFVITNNGSKEEFIDKIRHIIEN